MAAWDNQVPVQAPNYNPPAANLGAQLAALFQQQPGQNQQQQAQPQPQPLQQPGQQPMNIQPQLPLAQRLAQLLGNFGQPGSAGTIGGTAGGPGGSLGSIY